MRTESDSKVFDALVILKRVANDVGSIYYYYKTAKNKVADMWKDESGVLGMLISRAADRSNAETEGKWSYKDLQDACNLLEEEGIIDNDTACMVLGNTWYTIENNKAPSNKKKFAEQHPEKVLTLAMLLGMAEDNLLSIEYVKRTANIVAHRLHFNSDALWEMVLKVYDELCKERSRELHPYLLEIGGKCCLLIRIIQLEITLMFSVYNLSLLRKKTA